MGNEVQEEMKNVNNRTVYLFLSKTGNIEFCRGNYL